ncbi:von Willebrand factor type A [Calothrix sp. NIES-4071]|nr:von Willebrand factor type A [Calothrix sp. NIES-4071]BAZ58281.1 von Willebrand factor type A [Calothrix sp. NIES-4105]
MGVKYLKHWVKLGSIPGIIAFGMSISYLCQAVAQTTPKGGIDWIVVVDTSASMRGVSGTKNIFDQVKSSVIEFVNTAQLGDTVTIYTFDRDVTLQTTDAQITSNEDRGKLKQIIRTLQANGMRTHTGKAVQTALQHSAMLNARSHALGRSVSIVFLTDGQEQVQGIPNPVPIPSNAQFLREQQCKPYIFFVSLGLKEHEKQLNDFANNPALCGKGRVLRDPGGVQLNQLAQNIRPVLVQPKLDINLPTANLQPVLAGTTTEPLNITAISNVNVKVSLQLEPNQSGIRLISPNSSIELAANQPTPIPLRLQIPANIQGGASNLRLVLNPANSSVAPSKVDLAVTIKSELQIQPASIDFGSTETGKMTETQTLVVKSNISGTAKLHIDGTKDVSVPSSRTSVLLQAGETKIPVQLEVNDSSFLGARNFTLVLTPDNPIASSTSTKAQIHIFMPLWRKIVLWFLFVLLVLLIALTVTCLIQRKTPFELLQDIRNRKYLEGAIFVLEPLPKSSEDEEISLTRLRKTQVLLSDLIPEVAATNSDAELVVVWEAGRKNIVLRCLKGVICVNTKEVTTYQLYDDDVIEIGKVKLQFNWIEHQRPFELASGEDVY